MKRLLHVIAALRKERKEAMDDNAGERLAEAIDPAMLPVWRICLNIPTPAQRLW